MKSNFEFLNQYWPVLAQIGAAAESYVYSDANACLYKLGMFGERLIREIFAFEHIKEPAIDNTHANRIRLLKREGLIPKKSDDILYALRKTRNDAVGGADKKLDRLREKTQLMSVLKRAQTAQRQLNTFVVIPVDISVEFLNKIIQGNARP